MWMVMHARKFFGTGQFGPFCVDSDGYDRWRMTTGDLFGGDVAVADADADGIFEMYCRALHDSAVYAIDAVTGDVFVENSLAAACIAQTLRSRGNRIGRPGR